MYRHLPAILMLVLSAALLASCGSAGEDPGSAETGSVTAGSTAAADRPAAESDGDTLDTWDEQWRREYRDFGVDSTVYASRNNAITRAVRKVSPAVVSITVTELVQSRGRMPDDFFSPFFFTPREYSSMGSGFIISEDGVVVTNEHVAPSSAREIVVSLPDGSQYDAEIIGSDELSDLTLLRIQADRSFPYASFGDSDRIMVGEWAIALGNPFGLFKSARPSVTVGVVSALHRDFRPDPKAPRVYMDMIQTDAAINRGNSGGPLVDSEGNVIGVNTFIVSGGTGTNVGLGFAIPSNRVISTIDQLLSRGEVEVPFDPGFEITPMTMQKAIENNLPAVGGLLVTGVNRDGPAFEGGILPGDIILKIGDERVHQLRHARALYRQYAEGDTMRIELLRDSRRYEAKMVLRQKVSGEGQ